ncbi:MAG: rod shape-determining protein MreD, partial [Phormidesmis sp.]
AIINETAMALQLSAQHVFSEEPLHVSLGDIWLYHQRVALSSAIISSLWAPVLFYPLKRWWEKYRLRD